MSLNDEPDENNHIFYDPCTLLRPVARAANINLDQLNFVTCLFLSFPIGYLYRVQLKDSSRTVRAAISAAIGLTMCYFCYGRAILHLLINGYVSYLLLLIVNPRHVHKAVFAFSMGYLLLIHAYRWMYQKSYCLDVTGSMMVAVGKATLLASAIHDGMGRGDGKDLTAGQARDAIKAIPSILDFTSYMFNFQTIIIGPMNHYSTWSSFLDLTHVPIDKKSGRPLDPTSKALEKFEVSLVFCVVYTMASPYLPMSVTSDPKYNELPLLFWWFWHALASTVHRLPYYFSWIISDSICNVSGFGFDGFDESTNEAKWSKTTNVRPLNVEVGYNYKEMVDNWNIWTVAWLRRVVYERVDPSYRTIAVYVTGAAWHGLAVGYYFSFLTSALFTVSAATCRRCVRHRVVNNKTHKIIYDVIGIVASKFTIGYVHYPFYVMHFWPSLFMYKKLLMSPQIIAAAIYLLLPRVLPPLAKSKSQQTISERGQLNSRVSTRTAKSTRTAVSIK